MTRALEVNPDTNFLESINPIKQAFTSDKKLQFLKLATDHITEHKEVPDILSICQLIGINVRTFQRHLNLDSTFQECYKEVLAKIDLLLTNDLYVKSKAKMGTLALLAMLRHNETGRWNQDQLTINHMSDNSSSKTILSSVNEYIEADIIDDNKQIKAITRNNKT